MKIPNSQLFQKYISGEIRSVFHNYPLNTNDAYALIANLNQRLQ